MTNYKKLTPKAPKYVKKLDNTDEFNLIKSNIKRARTLKEKDSERYSVWYNHFKTILNLKEKDGILWVADHWQTILKHIQDTYKPPQFEHVSRRHHLEGLGNVLLAIDKNKFRESTRMLFNEGKTIQVEDDMERLEGKLKPSELQNFVTYPELVAERDKLYNLWQQAPKNKKFNIYHLIVALNTYIPPLRRQWDDMEIYSKNALPPNNLTNYLWEYEPSKYAIVLNYDKIENKRQKLGKDREIFRLEDEIIGVTNGKKLNEIISKSLKDFPRNYVLSGIRTGGQAPMSKTSYDQALKSVFSPRATTTNLLRKAYINYWHNQNKSPKILGEIARRMRHTLGVASTAYRKININEVEQAPVKGPPTKITQKKEVPRPQPKEYFNPAQYMQEYRANNAEKIKEQRAMLYQRNRKKILRDKILRQLNLGATKNIPQSTKNIYGIYYDDENKVWTFK